MGRAATGRPVRFVSKRWPHHSRSSGYDRVVDYIGTAIEPLDLERLSSRWIPERIAIRFVRRAGVQGYSMASFYDEWAAAREMIARPGGAVYHVLYGDDTYRYLGTVRRATKRHRVVASYHLPPDVLRRRLDHTQHLCRADAVVVVGTNLVPLFAELCGPDRVHYIPHGVDTEVFCPDPARAAPEGEKGRVLFVGSHRRDVATLRAVVEQLGKTSPDIEFTFVTADRVAESFRGLRNVEVRGYVSEPDLIGLYQSSAVQVQPMEESTANNAILEGLACGLPVVATNVGGVGAYVDEACAVLTAPGEVGEMAEAIRGIVEDPDRRRCMSRAARERARTLAWPEIAAQLAALYEDLA